MNPFLCACLALAALALLALAAWGWVAGGVPQGGSRGVSRVGRFSGHGAWRRSLN